MTRVFQSGMAGKVNLSVVKNGPLVLKLVCSSNFLHFNKVKMSLVQE